MQLETQIKEWHSKLIPSGNYNHLGIEDVWSCKHLARYIQKMTGSSSSRLLVFGERYLISFDSGLNLPPFRGRQISFNDTDPYYDYLITTKELFPIPLKEIGTTWGAHFVYSDGNMIFDPILGEPCHTDDFSKKLFGEEIPHEEYKLV